MDKIEQLYKLYLEQGLITSATSLENFSGASDEQRTELYKLGGTKNLFSTTDLDTFKSAWTKEPVKTEAVAAETVPVTAQKKAVDTGLKSVNGSLEPEKKTDPDKPFDERYLDFASGYDKSKGKSRLYEDVYLKDWAGKPTGKGGLYPSNFEDYAKSFGTTLKQETSESLDGFEIKAVKSKEFKKKEENANKLRNKISKINPLNSKGSIGFEYLGFEDKGGYIAPKLEEKDRPYDYVKIDADGQKEVYKYGIPGPFDGYSKEYKNTYNQDLKNKLGESRYKQVEKAINGAAAKNIDLTKENLGEFIDLSLIPQNVQSKIVDNLQSNAADAFVQTLEEKERMDITSFLGTDSFKEAVRLDKELKQKDAEDYKRQYGKALVSEKTVMDLDTRQTRTFTPINTSFLNITGKSDLSEFKKLAENVYVKDQEDISNIVKNFDSTYEDYNKKVSTYQVRSKKVKDKYNKAKDVLSKNQTQENVDAVNAVVEEYKSMVNEDDFNSLNTTFESMTAMKLDLENRSKISLQDSEKLKLLGVQTSSLAKNYSNLDRLALQMEDFFIANPLLLVSDVGEWIGAGIQAVTPLNTSTVNAALKSGGTATMAYKNRLAEKIQNLPYTAKSGEDDYEIGNYLASTLADNGPSLLVTAATMLAAGGIGGAASLSTVARAASLSKIVHSATEYGGSLYDTKNARTQAQKTIIDLKDSLPFITDQGEIKYTESLIDGLRNTANVSDLQASLMAAAAAGIAGFMETYGALGTVDFMRKYSKVVGPESFKALLNPALKRYASIGTKAAIGAGTSVLGNNMEESLTALGQNFAKVLVLKEDIDTTEGIDTEFFKTNTLIGFAASGPTLSQNVTSMLNAEFNTSASVKKQKEASKELLSIQARIEEIKSSEAKPDSDIVSVISKAKQKQEIAKLEIEKTKKIEEISLMHSNVLLDVSQLSVDELNAVIDDNRVLRSLLNEAQELSSELEPGDSFTKNRLKKLESKYLEVLSSKENILNRPVKEIKEQFKKALNPVEAAYNKGLYLNINSIVKNIKGINTYEFGGEFGITALNRYIEDNNIGEADAKALIEGYKSGNNAANIGKDILLFTDNVDNALMQQSGARAKVAAVSAFHEVGHIQARQAGIVKDGKVVGDANAMMDGIFADIKYRKDIGEISQKDYDFFLERIGQYTNELDSKGNVIFNETKGVNVDELIQLVGDLTNSGVLKKSSYAKVFEIKNFINSFYKNKNGDASKFFKLDQPSDVFDFVASWTTKAKKGDIKFDSSDEEEKLVSSKSIADLNTELEELIDNEYEMDEGDFESQKSNLEFKIKQAKAVAETSKKPTVKKEGSTKEKAVSSKVYNNESLVETIKSKDSTTREKAKAEADLVDSFDSLALKAIKYDTRKGDYDREDVRDYLREFLPGIIERYDPSESKFSTYVTNTMAPKAQQTYEKFRKIADKSIDAEIGGVGSVKEMSGDINTLYGSDAESSGLKESTQKMIKATSFGPISDPAILEAVENVIEVKESERPNFKSLNNKYFDKVSEAIFGINGKKTRGNASLKYDKSGGSSEANSLQNVFKNDNDVKKFIKTMPDYNIATKETVVNEQGEIIDVSRDTYGRSIGINPKVLAIFYDKVQGAIPGVSSPNGRSLGLTTQTDVYKLKPEFTGNISPASVAKLQSLIGINKGTLSIPIKGEARTEFGSILTGLTKMYIDNVINTVGRSKLDSNQAKADLGAGKSSLMFSKSTLEGKYLTVNQKTTLINTVNSLKSKNTDNDLTNDVWSNIILNIDKSKNLYEVFNSISEVVKVVLTVKGQRTFEQNLLNSLLRSAKIDFKSVILDSFNEYRKIFKYEYRTIGFDFVKSKLKSDISEADSEESKKQVIKNFILFESRSIRTGKIDGIRTNEILFDKILKELGAEDLGFKVLKKDGRSYIALDKVVLTGMLDVTKVKEGFTPKTIALMNSEASSALNHVIKVLKGSTLNTAKGYLSLISLDQRGILRKISTPGFEITGFKPNRLILEHETTALSLYKKLIDFVEGNISEKELRDFVSKSKVNLIPETLNNLLNGKKVTAIDKARYSIKEFVDVLNKYKEKGRYKEAVIDSQEITNEQEIENNIGLLPSSNHESLLRVEFSKSIRTEYENVLKKKRPELVDIPRQVDNLFKWADGLNVPDNKKSKYKKLALYYTANGYTVFPEDGYKIEEVIRLSDKNKIDPYAYSNPDELINKFTKQVNAEKIDPDKVLEFTNKQEYDNNVVIYDVSDSKKGQQAVRNVVDSYWGKDSNPWCLITRDVSNYIANEEAYTQAEVDEITKREEALGNTVELEGDYMYEGSLVYELIIYGPKNTDGLDNSFHVWNTYNTAGNGFKIAFQNGKLSSFRDGGKEEVSPDANWWNRFDKDTTGLSIRLGKDKSTGYSIIGEMDEGGVVNVSGYGEGDFMSKKNNFKLYDENKNLVEQKIYKDGKISLRITTEKSRLNDGGRAIARTENKYIDGELSSSVYTLKDLRTGDIVTKATTVKTFLNNESYIENYEIIGVNGRSPKLPKLTRKTITLVSKKNNKINQVLYYKELIRDGVSTIIDDKRAELEDFKKSNRTIRFSKSILQDLKETAVYKKFNKTLDGKKLYHGGSGIIKSPNVNSEDHLTWFYVDVAEAAMDWVEGKTTTSTQQYLYEVDFNSIAEDHVVFPDFELIPYTIIKEAVDKVYPKGGYLPEANNIKNPYGAIEIMKDPKAGKILEEFLKWSLNNNAAYEYYTGDPLIEKGKISEGQAIIVLGEISRDKSKKTSFSKSINLDKEFNDIIENKTGIASYKEFAAVKAALRGQKKGRFDFFIPPSAEDFVGLLYYTLGKGTVGDSQMKWYKDNLLNPYARAVENITRDRNNLGRDFLALKKDLKIIPKNLKKKTKGGDFTREQAIRVYIWNEIGKDVPGLSKLDLVELVDIVNSDPQLKLFAQEIMKLNKGRAYVSPADGWVTGTITTDLLESLNTTGRKQYLELWKQNVDIIFSEKNLNKLEAAYGKSYRYALENMLHRMETGRNRTYGMDSTTGRFTDWINGSTAAIMFFNTRSALLQTISAVNFINFGDNNVIAAGKAFANQKQYWSDFKLLFNSEFLTERRDGLKININEADIADIAKEKGVRGVINKLLKLGFLPTQIADSFAIASGGSTFYRNRVKSLVKGGMNTEAAEKQAMRDFREIAEESQQSSRPDKISSQQAGPLGRIILAFANTPAQYARIIKKSASDLKNGRGDAKTNLAKILYYGVAQNILFNTLQQAMFAMLFEGDEEDDSILAEKKVKVINGMVDSIARGTGLYGAVFTVVKNASVRIYEQTQKKNPDYRNTYLELLKISPPISSKIQKFASAEKTASWNMKEIKSKGFSLDNPGFLAAGKVISSTTNIPLDRAIRKLNNLKAASDSQVETYKRIALLAGWSEWELGMKKKKEVKSKSTKKSTKVKYWTKSPY